MGAIFFLRAYGPLRVPHDKDMITAAFSLAFHGFLHCGELTSSIKWQNIKIDMARQCLDAWLQWSKTDPSGKGTTITVGTSTNLSICRVRKLTEYKQICRSTGSAVKNQNGALLTRAALTTELRTLLPLCGVTNSDDYASHSFCIGAATSAAMAGVPEYLIRHMVRWRGDVVLNYVRIQPLQLTGVSTELSKIR